MSKCNHKQLMECLDTENSSNTDSIAMCINKSCPDKDALQKIVKPCYARHKNLRDQINNDVTFSALYANSLLECTISNIYRE